MFNRPKQFFYSLWDTYYLNSRWEKSKNSKWQYNISIIKNSIILNNCIDKEPVDNVNLFVINGSELNVIGIYKYHVEILGVIVPLKLFVVPDNTMSFSALLGRDFTGLKYVEKQLKTR